MIVSSVLPPEIAFYINLEEWQDIVQKLMDSEDEGNDYACYFETCLCICLPITLPFVICTHLCIQDCCIKMNRRQKCSKINSRYFGGKPVFVCGEQNSICINYSLLNEFANAVVVNQEPQQLVTDERLIQIDLSTLSTSRSGKRTVRFAEVSDHFSNSSK